MKQSGILPLLWQLLLLRSLRVHRMWGSIDLFLLPHGAVIFQAETSMNILGESPDSSATSFQTKHGKLCFIELYIFREKNSGLCADLPIRKKIPSEIRFGGVQCL